MTAIRAFFTWLFAGVISSLLLVLVFVGIDSSRELKRELDSQKLKVEEIDLEWERITTQIEELRVKKQDYEKEWKNLNLKDSFSFHFVPIHFSSFYEDTKENFDRFEETFRKISANSKKLFSLMERADDYMNDSVDLISKRVERIERSEEKIKDIVKEVIDEQGKSRWYFVKQSFRENFRRFLFYAMFLVFIVPVLWKVFIYYAIARFIETRAPVKASGTDEYVPSIVIPAEGVVSLDYPLEGAQKLYLRAGNWGKRRTNIKARTKFLWNYHFPIVSIAADLVELVELTALPGKSGSVAITSPDPDMFISRIQLTGDRGIVIRPRYLIGVTEEVDIRTKWNFNIHNILSGRIRQIILYGNGTVFITGCWGIDCKAGQPDQDNKIEDNLILAYETSSEYSLCRTETFWHYLRNSATLFDLRIRKGTFLTQNNTPRKNKTNETVFERILGAVLNGIGNFLGF